MDDLEDLHADRVKQVFTTMEAEDEGWRLSIVELEWLKHLCDHGKLFEPWVVRANEG